MSEELKLVVEIAGQDTASAALRSVIAMLKRLEKQAEKTGAAMRASLGGGMLAPSGASGVSEVRSIQKVATARAKAAGDAVRNAGKVWRLRERSEKAEIAGIANAGKTWAAEQRRRMGIMSRSEAIEMRRIREVARAEARAIRETATARMKADRDTYREVRARWAIRERSERHERREAERQARATAANGASQAKAEAAASGRRLNDIARTWRMRERSEAAELAHVRKVGRERAALHRNAMRSARDAGRHGRHAVRSMNHPVHESAGFALATGAAAGAAFTGHVVQASEAFDTAMARLRMFAPQLDANAIRRQSLDDSIALGVDASKLVDAIAKSVRDGVPPEIARTLPKSIASAAQVMGGDVEKLTDSLAEGLQEAFSMGWLKTSTDARRFLNTEAGLSTFAGNSAAKQEQFIAAGGLGHGKEMGIDMTSTLAYGAMLNASGARTGQASARFMGQLSQNVPRMYDRYRQAANSHRNSEEDRAVRSAPGQLGYGGVREMQHRIMAGPEGLIDFATRLQKLDDKTRKLVLEGYGFSEQSGAMLAELGANGGTKGKAVLARAKELSEQKEADDYLSEKFAEWQKSLSNMLRQIEAGWRAIENEIGDVIKSDIVAPLRDWWVELSGAIVHSDLKDRIHRAIVGFVHGLGFEDVRQMLDGITANAKGFDIAGFMTGIGEGIRAVVDDFRSLGSVFSGGAGGISAETVGRVATEMLGLSLALKAVSPVLTVMTGIIEGFRALSAVLATARGLGFLMGIAGAGEGAGALATLGAGAAATGVGLAAMLGLAVVAGGIAVTVMNWDAIKDFINGKPQETPEERAARPVRRLEDQTWWEFLSGAPKESIPLESDNSRAADKRKGIFHRQSYDGAGFGDLRRNISWSPSDSGDVTRNAILGTERGVVSVREAIDRLGTKLALATSSGSAASGIGSGGAGLSNLRYGRTSSGAYRSSPGGPGAGGGSGMTAVSKDLTPESRALLDTLASGEAPDYNVMNGGSRFSDYSHHPGGRAAGRYQFLPSTWRRVSGALGLKDFSPESQDKGAWWLAQQDYKTRTGRNLQADLASKDPARIAAVGRALHSTWVSLNGSFGGKYAGYLGRQSGSAGPANAGGIAGHVVGDLKMDDETFRYGSGGVRGSQHIPFGDYPINPDAPGAWGRAHNAMAVNGTGSIWDASLGRMRTGIEMHVAHSANMITEGCVSFLAQDYDKLKGKVRDMIAKKGHAYLHIGPNGASITPDALVPADIATKVHSRGRVRPGDGDPPASNTTAADSSTTHHTWHVYGEPARQAVVSALPGRHGGMTIDRDAFA